MMRGSNGHPGGTRTALRGRTAARAAWGPLDQALSSLTNLVPALLIAGRGSASDFANIAIVLLAVNLSLGLVRSLTGEITVAQSGDAAQSLPKTEYTSGAALLVGLACAAALAALGLLLGASSAIGEPLLFAAATVPFIAVQDQFRYANLASGKGQVACASDGLWLLLLVAGAALSSQASWQSAATKWAVAGAIAGAITAAWQRTAPNPLGGGRWLRENLPRGRTFGVEYMSVAGASTTALLLVGAVAPTGVIAAIRGLQLAAAPIAIALGGLSVTMPRALARHGTLTRLGSTTRLATLFSTVAAAGGATIAIALGFSGSRFLGSTWPYVEEIRWLIVPYVASVALGVPYRAFVRIGGGEKVSAQVNLYLSPLVLALPAITARTSGAVLCMATICLLTLSGSLAQVFAAHHLDAHRTDPPVGAR